MWNCGERESKRGDFLPLFFLMLFLRWSCIQLSGKQFFSFLVTKSLRLVLSVPYKEWDFTIKVTFVPFF
jgi:hypothetical protein